MSSQTRSSADEDSRFVKRLPETGWGEILLAALPFLLILLLYGLPKLLVEGGLLTWEHAGMRVLNIGLAVLFGVSILVAFILAWRRRSPAWSAVWYPLFCLPLLLILVGLASLMEEGQLNLTINQDYFMILVIPTLIAVLLYAVARLDPRRGLLASLPIIYVLWLSNLEFVPDAVELAVKVPSILLFCLAIAFVLRRDDWRAGLYAVLVMNFVVGSLFAYAGIYHGGTLPFVAPGPNLEEVVRSLIPQYLATSAILLGPLFAWKYRQAGLFRGGAGKIAYHLALAGLFVVILANLASLMLSLQVDTPDLAGSAGEPAAPAIVLGMGAYLAGAFWLFRSWPTPRTASRWAEHVLLFLLPLAIPIVLMLTFITWKWPVSGPYGIPLLWEIPHALSLSLEMVWLGLSVWVVTRGEQVIVQSLWDHGQRAKRTSRQQTDSTGE